MEDIRLTDPEQRALRAVADGDGKVGWYHLARLITPSEYPDKDTNPVHLLAQLARFGLIAETAEDAKIRRYSVTTEGLQWLEANAAE